MTIAANLGYPRIGPRRELKSALESFWAGRSSEDELRRAAAALRARSRAVQQGAGIGHLPSGDFALYDHVLETACAFGAVPPGKKLYAIKLPAAPGFEQRRAVVR
jgi:5-methyltetrahydropteroyltriglutamate--homocysteine methyltransferase